MHLGMPELLEFYRAHRQEPALVLATITATEGSTYRKTGAMLLASADGGFAGLISGGCLEGDLMHHVRRVFETGEALTVDYDMSAGDDLVWNLGLGCDGVIHLLLQRLERNAGLAVLEQIDRAHRERKAVLLAVVSDPAAAPRGALGLVDADGATAGDSILSGLLERHAKPWPDWRTRVVKSGSGVGPALLVHVPAPTRVLICGAGPDALPLARILDELDWEVVVVDHRADFARPERFPRRCRVVHSRPRALAEQVAVDQFDGALVMSHHLENDAEYLRRLAAQPPRYLGLLGPAARKERLREMANCPSLTIHGPAGLDIGSELPASIALSIAAEMHAVLNGRDGRSLECMSND
jgi:xanthine/CO dehydrogenase XdhC/CoxF family maturation factor